MGAESKNVGLKPTRVEGRFPNGPSLREQRPSKANLGTRTQAQPRRGTPKVLRRVIARGPVDSGRLALPSDLVGPGWPTVARGRGSSPVAVGGFWWRGIRAPVAYPEKWGLNYPARIVSKPCNYGLFRAIRSWGTRSLPPTPSEGLFPGFFPGG